VIQDRASPTEGGKRHIEVVAGVEVAHEDPVRDASRSDLAAVAWEREDVRHPIQSDVSDQVREADRIELARIDMGVPAANGDRQREIANPRKQVHDDRA
jgi:hypothetical protein